MVRLRDRCWSGRRGAAEARPRRAERRRADMTLPRPVLHAAGGAGDDVAARHRAVRRRSAAGDRRGLPVVAAAGVGVGGGGSRGSSRPAGSVDSFANPQRAVANVRRAGRGRQAALRPGRRHGAGPLRERLQSSRAGSTTASTSRGGSPVAGTRSPARSADRHRVGPAPSSTTSPIGGQPSPAQAETITALEAQLASAHRLVALADRSATASGSSTPASTSSSPAPPGGERRRRRHRRPRQRRRRPRERAREPAHRDGGDRPGRGRIGPGLAPPHRPVRARAVNTGSGRRDG